MSLLLLSPSASLFLVPPVNLVQLQVKIEMQFTESQPQPPEVLDGRMGMMLQDNSLITDTVSET